MKSCFKCGAEKALDAFYRHPQMPDGHLNKCRECTKIDVRQNRAAKLDYYQEYDRKRGLLPHRKLGNKHRAPNYTEKRREWSKHYYFENAERAKAHTMVGNAVRAGKLMPKPCERCGFAIGVQAHHEDYSKPMDVIWFCTKHHGERHREINAERRAQARAA